MSSSSARIRLAAIVDRDLVCWRCGEPLIGGYLDLLAASGPVPFFGEMTFACTKCSASNRSPSGAKTGAGANRSGDMNWTEARQSGWGPGPEEQGDGP
jgi:hypothetical protein